MTMCTLLIKPALQSLTIKLLLVVVQLFFLSHLEKTSVSKPSNGICLFIKTSSVFNEKEREGGRRR